MNKYGRTTFILPFTDGHIPYILSQSREFDSFIYQNNLAGLIKPTFFMSIF